MEAFEVVENTQDSVSDNDLVTLKQSGKRLAFFKLSTVWNWLWGKIKGATKSSADTTDPTAPINTNALNGALTNKSQNINQAYNSLEVDFSTSSVSKIQGFDGRYKAYTPIDYISRGMGVYNEFNNDANLFSTGVSYVYYTVITIVPWSDSSGGLPWQLILGNSHFYIRQGTSNDNWGEVRIIF